MIIFPFIVFCLSMCTAIDHCPSETCSQMNCENCTTTVARSCPLYSTTLMEGADSVFDCVCVPGTYGNRGYPCTPCPRGSYTSLYDQEKCTTCLYGTLPDKSDHVGATNDSICSLPPYQMLLTMAFDTTLSETDVYSLRLNFASFFNVSIYSVSIEQSQITMNRLRRLLSVSLTITVSCPSSEILYQWQSTVNQEVINTCFTETGLSIPGKAAIRILSYGVTTQAQLPTDTLAQTTTPQGTPSHSGSPQDHTSIIVISVVSGVVGLSIAISVGVWCYYNIQNNVHKGRTAAEEVMFKDIMSLPDKPP